ncbi:MAG: hypothetical protein ACJAQT_005040 [Akkermansiaceae bacterium]|jgi:hypothetical protein
MVIFHFSGKFPQASFSRDVSKPKPSGPAPYSQAIYSQGKYQMKFIATGQRG